MIIIIMLHVFTIKGLPAVAAAGCPQLPNPCCWGGAFPNWAPNPCTPCCC